jgi:hypothetical protein
VGVSPRVDAVGAVMLVGFLIVSDEKRRSSM